MRWVLGQWTGGRDGLRVCGGVEGGVGKGGWGCRLGRGLRRRMLGVVGELTCCRFCFFVFCFCVWRLSLCSTGTMGQYKVW